MSFNLRTELPESYHQRMSCSLIKLRRTAQSNRANFRPCSTLSLIDWNLNSKEIERKHFFSINRHSKVVWGSEEQKFHTNRSTKKSNFSTPNEKFFGGKMGKKNLLISLCCVCSSISHLHWAFDTTTKNNLCHCLSFCELVQIKIICKKGGKVWVLN